MEAMERIKKLDQWLETANRKAQRHRQLVTDLQLRQCPHLAGVPRSELPVRFSCPLTGQKGGNRG